MSVEGTNINPQSIKEINTILDQAVKSKTGGPHVYVVIHSQSKLVGLTYDKNLASSMKEVAFWMHDISQKVFQDPSMNRDEIRKLRHNFNKLKLNLKGSERKEERGILQRISEFVSFIFFGKTTKLIEKTEENLDKGLSSYGKEQVRNKQDESIVTRTIDYAKHAERRLEAQKKAEVDIDQLEKIKDLENLEMRDIEKAFSEELFKVFNPRWAHEKVACALVTEVFEDMLQSLSDKVESGESSPAEAIAQFKSGLVDEIHKKNRIKHELDRETFRDLMGTKVKDGLGDKISNDIDLSLPKIKELIKKYNEDKWTEGQIEILEYDIMNDLHFEKMEAALNVITSRDAFQGALIRYFNQINHSAIDTAERGIISSKPDIRPSAPEPPKQPPSASKSRTSEPSKQPPSASKPNASAPPKQPQASAAKSAAKNVAKSAAKDPAKTQDKQLPYEQLQKEISIIKADLVKCFQDKYQSSRRDNPLRRFHISSLFDLPTEKIARDRFQNWFNAVKSKLEALKEAIGSSMENFDSYVRNADHAELQLLAVFQLKNEKWENEKTRNELLARIDKVKG